jgi:hypothetical protein
MATKPKTDPLSLRKRVHAIIARDIRAVEATQRANKNQLDAKTAAQMVAYAKALNEQLQEEEMWARRMLAEASKLSIAELQKRAEAIPGQPVQEEVEDDDETEEAD